MQGQLTADRACANNNIDMESVPGDRHWLYVLPGRGMSDYFVNVRERELKCSGG